MAVTVASFDRFNRANSTSSLGTDEGGLVWTQNRGTWGISSNSAYTSAANNTNDAGGVASVDVGSSIQTAQITILGQPSAGTNPSVIVRATDADNFWIALLYRNAGNTATAVYAGKVVAGVGTYSIANNVVVTPSYPVTFRLVASGADLISVFLDGVSKGTPVTDTFNNTATKAGIASYNTTLVNIDDWVCTTPIGSFGTVY